LSTLREWRLGDWPSPLSEVCLTAFGMRARFLPISFEIKPYTLFLLELLIDATKTHVKSEQHSLRRHELLLLLVVQVYWFLSKLVKTGPYPSQLALIRLIDPH
jgi:hypothetical protein